MCPALYALIALVAHKSMNGENDEAILRHISHGLHVYSFNKKNILLPQMIIIIYITINLRKCKYKFSW